jgi:hypothetical protein
VDEAAKAVGAEIFTRKSGLILKIFPKYETCEYVIITTIKLEIQIRDWSTWRWTVELFQECGKAK